MIGWPVVLVWALAASALHVRERRRVLLAARAGHEIRGPLASARLALGGLERSARVEAIDLELRRAALALEDLAGGVRRPALLPVEVGALVAEAAEAWKPLAEARGSALVVEPGRGVVLADPLRLVQACANLVANALEHGGGSVTVRTRSVASGPAGGRATARVRIEVTDAGPGLPAPVPVLVAAARGRRTPRGHGLAIAASIAERHGGRLLSAPSESGARLVLELPEAPPRTPPPRRLSPSTAGRPRRPLSPPGESSAS